MREYTDLLDLAPIFIQVTEDLYSKWYLVLPHPLSTYLWLQTLDTNTHASYAAGQCTV